MRRLQLGLTFDDARIEQEFESFYAESLAGYARRMLLLVIGTSKYHFGLWGDAVNRRSGAKA
jgi:hypothetical protein